MTYQLPESRGASLFSLLFRIIPSRTRVPGPIPLLPPSPYIWAWAPALASCSPLSAATSRQLLHGMNPWRDSQSRYNIHRYKQQVCVACCIRSIRPLVPNESYKNLNSAIKSPYWNIWCVHYIDQDDPLLLLSMLVTRQHLQVQHDTSYRLSRTASTLNVSNFLQNSQL